MIEGWWSLQSNITSKVSRINFSGKLSVYKIYFTGLKLQIGRDMQQIKVHCLTPDQIVWDPSIKAIYKLHPNTNILACKNDWQKQVYNSWYTRPDLLEELTGAKCRTPQTTRRRPRAPREVTVSDSPHIKPITRSQHQADRAQAGVYTIAAAQDARSQRLSFPSDSETSSNLTISLSLSLNQQCTSNSTRTGSLI